MQERDKRFAGKLDGQVAARSSSDRGNTDSERIHVVEVSHFRGEGVLHSCRVPLHLHKAGCTLPVACLQND